MIIKFFLIFLFLPIVTLTFAQNVKIPASVAFTIAEKELIPESLLNRIRF